MTCYEHDVGICRETKNSWEHRAPLTPSQVAELVRAVGLRFAVQPDPNRAFPDDEYSAAGAVISESLDTCRVVLGIKEMPLDYFRPGGRYALFAHVIKGQPYNMPMLKRLMELGCDLFDYERIADDAGRRLVFFGRFAGIAGAVETLIALGRRLAARGVENPFAGLKPPHAHQNIGELMKEVVLLRHRIRREGLPGPHVPLVIGVAGYGHVGRGVLEVLDALGVVDVTPENLPALCGLRPSSMVSHPGQAAIYRVVFREEHMAEPAEPSRAFDLDEYYRYPERFKPAFEERLPFLDVLVNCIFWTERYPRLVTREWLRGEFAKPDGPRLKVIGDISCDVRGAVEATVRVTDPGDPTYVYDPDTDRAVEGTDGRGVVVMAVENLPCELPVDSSEEFGRVLAPFVPALAADGGADAAAGTLPAPLARALILRRGELTEDYRYLGRHLEEAERR
ncbi:MAG TPA: hypothetical protein ENN51_03120 [candidate division WOR-3 bacterium]|uniref:Saccharopine dehydrogenase [NAD(+), L-lysine-forming] n=1 Tax=candidate division WOR-3 bacterium TaxID=2052148 RepID=A0A7V0XEN4_UNCW3|nr:hypothetical protein [candidate division WOR-3 bacterium]